MVVGILVRILRIVVILGVGGWLESGISPGRGSRVKLYHGPLVPGRWKAREDRRLVSGITWFFVAVVLLSFCTVDQ